VTFASQGSRYDNSLEKTYGTALLGTYVSISNRLLRTESSAIPNNCKQAAAVEYSRLWVR